MVTLLRCVQLNAQHVIPGAGSLLIKTKSSMGSWKLFVFVVKQPQLQLKISLSDSGKFDSRAVSTFANLPHSRTLPEAITTGKQMKSTVTFSRFMDSLWFEHCWKHLG